MENLLLILLKPLQLSLTGVSLLLLASFLFLQYYKRRFLPVPPRLGLIYPAEQRRMARFDSPSFVEVEDASGQHDAAARLVNMSLGGLCFASDLPLKPGETVQAKISSSKEWQLQIAGHIVWRKPENQTNLYGIEIQRPPIPTSEITLKQP